MRSSLPRLALALALASAGLGASAAFLPAPPVFADQIDEQVAALREHDKNGDEGKAVALIVELEGRNDARIVAALVDLAKSSKGDRVAIASMKQAATRKSPDLLKWLKSKLDDDRLLEKHPDRYKAVLDCLARYGDKGALKPLEDVVKKYLPQDGDLAGKAIAAYGSVREKPVVEMLLKWLAQTESTAAGQGGKNASQQTRDAYAKAKVSILETLTQLTGQDISDAGTWNSWWESNKKTFEFPDPNAAEVDPATLAEFVDKAYGWTMKKPEGKGWTFAKSDAGGARVRLVNMDESNLMWVRVDAITWKPSGEISNAKGLADFWVARWQKDEFSEFTKQPVIEARKIGGKDFLVASAKGIAAGSWKNWEGCERRLYVHQVHPQLLLYFDAACRSGAEDPLKTAFWGAIEGIVFKK
jgi:hypothetical protein